MQLWKREFLSQRNASHSPWSSLVDGVEQQYLPKWEAVVFTTHTHQKVWCSPCMGTFHICFTISLIRMIMSLGTKELH